MPKFSLRERPSVRVGEGDIITDREVVCWIFKTFNEIYYVPQFEVIKGRKCIVEIQALICSQRRIN